MSKTCFTVSNSLLCGKTWYPVGPKIFFIPQPWTDHTDRLIVWLHSVRTGGRQALAAIGVETAARMCLAAREVLEL
jgi:hypothetical protein